MKMNKFFVFLLTASMMVFVSCGNDDNEEDFRDAYVGSYMGDCAYHYSNGSDYQFDTVYNNESLSVSKNADNGLTIDFRNMTFSVQCTKDGEIPVSSYNPHSNCFGRFKGDSLYFEYNDVSQGNASSLSFNGRKK